jgi:predicted metalloprotease with PDZ domain
MLRTLALAAALPLLLGARAPQPIQYQLGVEAPAGATPYLTIELRFRGDADGETTLLLPDDFASGKDAWKHVSGLTVDGAQIAQEAEEKRVLRHRPNARITVRYVVASAYQEDPAAGGNPYAGPLLRPQWIAALGDFVFAAPADHAKTPATFKWGKVPTGWTFASDLEHGRMGRPMTVGDVIESITFGGPTATITQHPIPGGVLRVIAPAGPLRDGPLAANTAKVIAAQRGYWNDLNEPYLVAALPLTQPKPSMRSLGGTGRSDGFVVYATPGLEDHLLWLLGHEHAHTWIPRLLGEMPAGAEEPLAYWFSEGVTDFLAVRTLVRAGLWTPEEGVKRLSEFLTAYDASPVRTAPNARIATDFWKDQNVEKLPYQRGLLLALKWDEDLRKTSQGRLDFDDVLISMRDRRRAYPAEKTVVDDALLDAAWGVARLNLRADLARYVVRGEFVTLPETLFGGCVDVATKVSPAFDTGFDHTKSVAAKVVQGVRRGGPAWNSGLRNGMKLEGGSVREGDTTTQVEFKVVERRGRKRTIRYWPYGDEDKSVRSLHLRARMTETEKAACARAIGGL